MDFLYSPFKNGSNASANNLSRSSIFSAYAEPMKNMNVSKMTGNNFPIF